MRRTHSRVWLHTLVRDGVRFDALRTLRLENCRIDNLETLSHPLPLLTRLSLHRMAVRPDAVLRFLRDTADRLEWLELESMQLEPPEPKDPFSAAATAAAVPTAIVMRALVFPHIPVAILRTSRVEFPAIVQMSTEDVACSCRPAIRWTDSCPTVEQCDVHRNVRVHAGTEFRFMCMMRLASVPLAAVSTSIKWVSGSYEGRVALNNSLPSRGNCYAALAPLYVRRASVVDVWDVRLMMPAAIHLNHGATMWGRRAKIAHLIDDGRCRIGDGTDKTIRVPTAESVILQLDAAYRIRNGIHENPLFSSA